MKDHKSDQLNFIFIGPQRTGTSWIDNILRQNPMVCLPRNVKETLFFDQHYEKGIDHYIKYFQPKQNTKIFIEVAPTYFINNKTAERIHVAFPNCKTILIIRNPIEQAFSLYLHHKAKGRVKGSLIDAVKVMPEIVEGGHYKKYMNSWINNLGEENLLIFHYSEINRNPKEFYIKLLKKLDLPYYDLDDSFFKKYGKATNPRFKILAKYFASMASFLRRNDLHFITEIGKKVGFTKIFGGKTIRPISDQERKYLEQIYQEDIKFIESEFGKNNLNGNK